MDTKVKGLVIKCKDFKEADKILTILSAEEGKIYVRSKGVKKPTSKLKGFCQNFCFADFELHESNTGIILTGAKSIDFFYELTQNFDKYTYGCAILEILDKVCKENISYATLLIDTLKCLKMLNYEDVNPTLLLCKFILSLLSNEGLNFNTEKCNQCLTPFLGEAYLDLASGEMLCTICKPINNIMVEKSVLSTIKMLSLVPFDKLSTIKTAKNILMKTLNLLSTYLSEKYEISFNYTKMIF